MRAVAVIHQDDAGPGVFAELAEERGHELVPWRPGAGEERPPGRFGAALVFGGAMNVDQERAHPWLRAEKAELRRLLEDGVPLLGVCLGAQLVAEAAGARVGRAAAPEIGWTEVRLEPEAAGDPVIGRLPQRFCSFQWHSYAFELPPGAVPLARSGSSLQAFRAGESAWGIQFHAEVTSEIVAGWTRDYESDPDAVAIGLDPRALLAETGRRIAAWNELGRELCGRFLSVAEG